VSSRLAHAKGSSSPPPRWRNSRYAFAKKQKCRPSRLPAPARD